MAKNYYAILDIASNAMPEEVKASYRRLAKEYHPDHYTGSSEIFREIQEAYSVLGNLGRRCRYEKRIRKVPLKRQAKRASHLEPDMAIPEQKSVDFGQISPIRSFQTFAPSFDEIFDWRYFSGRPRPM